MFNPTAVDINMSGWVIRDSGIDSHTITGTLVVPAGGYIVLGRTTDSTLNGGVTVDYAYGTAINLGNADDELILQDTLGVEIDRVEYTDAAFPDITGRSLSLDFSAGTYPGDNNVGSSWCASPNFFLSPFGCGDYGTPGAANPSCD